MKGREQNLPDLYLYTSLERKASGRNWRNNKSFQPTLWLSSAVEVVAPLCLPDLKFINLSYTLFQAPVLEDQEFPCEESSLYGHWNPYNVNPSLSPLPAVGTSDQYELGDLSGKFGKLDGLGSLHAVYNDTRLPLFGTSSVLGRSVVINKKDKNVRWSCSSIERGYAPGEARELRAIASFHHPHGYAWGYIRMVGYSFVPNNSFAITKMYNFKFKFKWGWSEAKAP